MTSPWPSSSLLLLVLSVARLLSPVWGLREYESGTLPKYQKCEFLDGVYTSVMRRIYNPGFHKDLSTEVEIMLTTSLLPERCRLVVEETLPKGMYVDPDQLRDVAEFTGLRTFTAATVDVEKPEYDSQAFRLYVFKDLVIQENLRLANIELPVHLRYHKPRPPTKDEQRKGDGPKAIVRMQNPRLLLACDEDAEVARACADRTVTAYCDSTGTSKCEYLHLPYKVNVNAVEVAVPVGDSMQTPTVVGVTTLIICGGTIYLIGSIFRKTTDPRGGGD